MRGLRSRFRFITRRDAILLLLGAASMHLYSSFSPPPTGSAIIFNTHLSSQDPLHHIPPPVQPVEPVQQPVRNTRKRPPLRDPPPPSSSLIPDIKHEIPQTELVSHAPGWTIFRNLYMADGTLFIVTSNPDAFPDIKLITSTGLPAENTPESITERMPTSRDMSIISPEEARRRWGGEQSTGEPNRIFPIEGSTLLFNDPGQFLAHYYHFCAELLFGAWAFWYGTFQGASPMAVPTLTRAIFPHAEASEWRDGSGMNSFFLRSTWPSLTVETRPDWLDRASATALRAGDSGGRSWWFDTVLLSDRSAAFRGPECGERTQRTAAEAVKGVVERVGRTGFLQRGWWEPVRTNVLRFVGVDSRTLDIGTRAYKRASRGTPRTGGVEEIEVTYVSRQNVHKRRLVPDDHDGLVRALTELCDRRGWKLNVPAMERLTAEEQLEIAARTTFLVGVHGNGLTHLVMMPITPISTVIEIFYPEGYAHDYEWTTRALGMKHFAVWNDTSTTYPEVTWPNYPEGFQGQQVPVHGPYVAKLIEDRADGFLP